MPTLRIAINFFFETVNLFSVLLECLDILRPPLPLNGWTSNLDPPKCILGARGH